MNELDGDLTTQMFTSMFEAISNGIIVINQGYGVEEINDRCCKYICVNRDEAIGKKCFELKHAGKLLNLNESSVVELTADIILSLREPNQNVVDRVPCQTELCPMLSKKQVHYYLQQGNETLKFFQITETPILTDLGEVKCIVKEFKDITRLIVVERDVRIRDSILESSINAIAISDLNGQITYANRAFLKLWGESCEEVIGQKVTRYWQTDDEILLLLRTIGRWIGEREAHRKDGTTFDTQILASVVVDEHDNPICIVTSFIDITELKRAKEEKIKAKLALASAKANIDAIKSFMEAVVIGIAITDLNGTIRRINKGFEETFGIKERGEAIGKHITNFIAEKHIQGIQQSIQDCIRNGHSSGMECNSILGSTLTIDFTLMRDSRDRDLGIIAVIRDITERKRYEEKLKDLSSELARKNKELEQVLYVTSHDLRSPLVNIQGFSKELENACKELRLILERSAEREAIERLIDEDILGSLSFIKKSASKMDSLINGILKVSRLGRIVLNIKEVDMNKVIRNVLDLFDFQIKQNGVTLQLSDLPSCHADEEQISHVFNNLIGNAIKYLDPTRKGIIKIYGQKDDGKVIYCVEDNGIGIQPEHLERIFDLFYRVNRDKVQGEGLGLSIVKKIVEKHRGHVYVESQPGVGSKFFVSLPQEM